MNYSDERARMQHHILTVTQNILNSSVCAAAAAAVTAAPLFSLLTNKSNN